jgi:peroxiredoxin
LPGKLRIGELAPAVKLPDLKGQIVDLAEFHGDKTLVMFWSPHCGFCDRMLDDLRAWEASPPKDTPQLVFISSGTVEDNQAMGINSPILLDQGFSAGRAFGASGTPSAILLDAEGHIASDLGVGAPAVWALAGVT